MDRKVLSFVFPLAVICAGIDRYCQEDHRELQATDDNEFGEPAPFFNPSVEKIIHQRNCRQVNYTRNRRVPKNALQDRVGLIRLNLSDNELKRNSNQKEPKDDRDEVEKIL